VRYFFSSVYHFHTKAIVVARRRIIDPSLFLSRFFGLIDLFLFALFTIIIQSSIAGEDQSFEEGSKF
jgi:hypothetical protein